MRTLKQALLDHELIVLRVIGEWWELDLTGANKEGSVEELARTLEHLNMQEERDHSPPEEAAAIEALVMNNGRIPVATFAREHGDVRMMGPGKLEREEPWFDPQNAAEALWYRGILYRGFDNTAEGMIEFYYLPEELYEKLADDAPAQLEPPTAPKAQAAPKPSPAVKSPEEDEEAELEYEDVDAFEEGGSDEDAFEASTSEANGRSRKKAIPDAPIGTEEDEPDFIDSSPPPKRAFRKVEPQYVPLDEMGREQEPLPEPESEAKTDELTAVDPPTIIPPDPTNAVDDLTSILIMAQRIGLDSDSSSELDKFLLNTHPDRRSLLINLASEMEMVRQTANGLRTTRTAVDWLQQSREQQLREMADAWSRSQWNELCRVPDIRCEGEWENDPILARNGVLEMLPRDIRWYRIQDLIQLIKKKNPDFQRPDGDYDTWYIRDLGSKQFVSGFENWALVEGRLIAYLLKGPLTWLGLVITAESIDGQCFSVTDRLLAWVTEADAPKDNIRQPLTVRPEGLIAVTPQTDRYHRFQAARISDPLPIAKVDEFLYRLTPDALAKALKQGITPERVQQFLETAGGRPLPAGINRAINRWKDNGIEGKLETVVILRVRDADIMQTLRTNPKTRDFIGESLGELAAAVKPTHKDALHSAVAQLGLLLDVDF